VTVTSWSSWIQQLQIAAERWLPLEPFVKDTLTPSFWDSTPIACNLREAALGFPNDERWAEGASDLLRSLNGKDISKTPLQKLMYNKLISHRFCNTLSDTVERRLTDLFQPFALDFRDGPWPDSARSEIRLDLCFEILKKLRVADVVKVLKCWCNGWATSRRYHEDKVLPCLFGCNKGTDDLQHYLQCPHLFALWSFLAGGASADPLMRWGLIRPESIKYNYIACIFSGYHAIRRDLRTRNEFFSYNQEVLTGSQIRASWSVFADAFFVEAREVAIQCRRFSLPSFLGYLNEPSFFNDSNG